MKNLICQRKLEVNKLIIDDIQTKQHGFDLFRGWITILKKKERSDCVRDITNYAVNISITSGTFIGEDSRIIIQRGTYKFKY